RAYGAFGARFAFHDETLAEVRFDSGGYGPEDRLGNASHGEWDDHANGLARPVLGEAARWPKRKQPGAQECQNASHRRMLRSKEPILYWDDRCSMTSSAFCSSARETSAARRPQRRFFESWLPMQGWRARWRPIGPARTPTTWESRPWWQRTRQRPGLAASCA